MIYKFDTGTGRISISTVGHDWRHSDFGTNFRIRSNPKISSRIRSNSRIESNF